MTKFIRKWFFPTFLLFVIMAEAIFHAFVAFLRIMEDSGKLQYLFIGISGITLLILFHDIRKGWLNSRAFQILIVLVIIVYLYLLSSLKVISVPDNYITYLLVFGSKSIPACIIGLHLANSSDNTLQKVDRLLPFFIIPVGIIIGLVGFRAAMMTEVVRSGGDESYGLNYQTLSYYMAEFYAYSAYYLFFSSARQTKAFKLLKWIMFAAMLFFAVNCIMGGGRGAMVFMVISTILIFFEMRKTLQITRVQMVVVVLGLLGVFSFLAIKFNIFESVGFYRVSENITNFDTRTGLYGRAIDSFMNSSLFGHGIGSVWWEVGFYSHNMILDILVETGIIGLFVLIIVGLKLYKRIYVLCRYDSCYFFLFLILVKETLHSMFSGYYMGEYYLWFLVGFVFVKKPSYYKNLQLYKK